MRYLVILLLVLVLAAVGVWVGMSSHARRAGLRSRFGPEYDRAVTETGSIRLAESELQAREQRRAGYEVRALPPESRERYRARWTQIQDAFVDAPDGALRDADGLVTSVLAERGYPTDDQDRLVGDLSVDLAAEHADVLDRFRAAHEIHLLNERREATTEDLRRGLQQYRGLMEDLAGEPAAEA